MKAILRPIICLLAVLSSPLLSQDGTITGSVVDRDTKEAIPSVNIRIHGTKRGTTTDSLGRFTLQVPTNTTHVLSFSHVAYKRDLYDLKMEEGQSLKVDVPLQQRTIGTNEVTVTGRKSFEDAVALRVITDEEISERNPERLDQLLRWYAPQVFTRTALSVMRRQREYVVYVNGLRVEGDPFTIIDPHLVEKISVWRSNWAPITYDSRGARFVVAVQTR